MSNSPASEALPEKINLPQRAEWMSLFGPAPLVEGRKTVA
jgi:hypothetical protein